MKIKTFAFSRIWVIASLPTDAEVRTAEGRARRIEALVADQETQVPVHFAMARHQRELRDLLETIAQQARERAASPLLQLEMHGSREGLLLASGETLPWSGLRGHLAEINVASRNNLLVVLAVCEGVHLKNAAVGAAMERAPFWGLIGTEGPVKGPQLAVGFDSFYRILLGRSDASAALAELNAERCGPAARFQFIPSDEIFRLFFRHYLIEQNTAKVRRRRVESIVTSVVSQKDAENVDLRHVRKFARKMLKPENQRAGYEALFSRFNMIDLYPENQDRFQASYESVLEMLALEA